MPSQNIYEYKKLKVIMDDDYTLSYNKEKLLLNKINELVIEYNHLAVDLELYKKAYKEHYHADHYLNPAK